MAGQAWPGPGLAMARPGRGLAWSGQTWPKLSLVMARPGLGLGHVWSGLAWDLSLGVYLGRVNLILAEWLGCAVLCCAGLGWAGLGWAGLGWLGWAGLTQ